MLLVLKGCWWQTGRPKGHGAIPASSSTAWSSGTILSLFASKAPTVMLHGCVSLLIYVPAQYILQQPLAALHLSDPPHLGGNADANYCNLLFESTQLTGDSPIIWLDHQQPGLCLLAARPGSVDLIHVAGGWI